MSDSIITLNKPTNMAALATFTCFRNLPIELRLAIWKLALPGPRTIEIGVIAPLFTSSTKSRTKKLAKSCLAQADKVALLATCQEARGIALKVYKQALTPFLRHPIYLSPGRDILFFDSRLAIHTFLEEALFPSSSSSSAASDSGYESDSDSESDYDDIYVVPALAAEGVKNIAIHAFEKLSGETFLSELGFLCRNFMGLENLVYLSDGKVDLAKEKKTMEEDFDWKGWVLPEMAVLNVKGGAGKAEERLRGWMETKGMV